MTRFGRSARAIGQVPSLALHLAAFEFSAFLWSITQRSLLVSHGSSDICYETAASTAKAPATAATDRRDPRPQNQPSERPVVYGVLPVLELLRADLRRIDKIVIAEGSRESRISEIVDLAREKDILIDQIDREKFGRHLSEPVNHQGVLAFTAAAAYADSDEILNPLGGDALILLLDGVEDPRNFGAILRTAECARRRRYLYS